MGQHTKNTIKKHQNAIWLYFLSTKLQVDCLHYVEHTAVHFKTVKLQDCLFKLANYLVGSIVSSDIWAERVCHICHAVLLSSIFCTSHCELVWRFWLHKYGPLWVLQALVMTLIYPHPSAPLGQSYITFVFRTIWQASSLPLTLARKNAKPSTSLWWWVVSYYLWWMIHAKNTPAPTYINYSWLAKLYSYAFSILFLINSDLGFFCF